MQTYKATSLYFYLFIGFGLTLIGLFVFSIEVLREPIYMLPMLSLIMFARAIGFKYKEILFLREDHFEFKILPTVKIIKYDTIVNIKTPRNLRYAKFDVLENNQKKKVTLNLEFISKADRKEFISLIRSKSQNLYTA